MVNYCAVKGCPSRSDKTPNLNFFCFPVSNPAICEEWKKRSGFTAENDKLKMKRVCSTHFQTTDFDLTSKRPKLVETCLPSLLLPRSSENVRPTHVVSIPMDETTSDYYVKIENSIFLKISASFKSASENSQLVFVAKNSESLCSPAIVVAKNLATMFNCLDEYLVGVCHGYEINNLRVDYTSQTCISAPYPYDMMKNVVVYRLNSLKVINRAKLS